MPNVKGREDDISSIKKTNSYCCHNILASMKLEVEQQEPSKIVASLVKSRHYFECIRRDQRTADSLQRTRLKLMKQGEKEGSL
ncbi:MAG TPA: hypothetical protein VJ799_07290 [Nitrososphaeraceae archaeon]|nr:hypothetical protein [Nitrososphaeraceae archaeon]